MTAAVSPPMPFTTPFRSRHSSGNDDLLPAALAAASSSPRNAVPASKTPPRRCSSSHQIKPLAHRPAAKPRGASQSPVGRIVKSP